jgi:hypothetical protein
MKLMPDQSASDGNKSEPGTESDRIFNAETNRALREWGRKLTAVGAGVLAAVVTLIPTAVTAARSPGIVFHLAVTLVVSLSLPVVACYVGMRTYGLSHQEVTSAARHAAREGAAATATLGEHQRVEQPAESVDTDPPPFTESDTDTNDTP